MPADTGRPGRRYVLRGGTVLSMDPAVGDLAQADVLVEGGRIAAVGPQVDAGDAEVVDVRGRIVVPGFVDTHHHQYQTALRSFLPNGLLVNDGSGSPSADPSYMDHIINRFTPHYRPEDVYLGCLAAGLAQLDTGVTAVLDVSQIHHTPEHSDAAVQALVDTGRRSTFGYFSGDGRPESRYPGDVRRIREQWFAGDDQLVTMAMGGEFFMGPDVFPVAWGLARELGIPVVAHTVGGLGMDALGKALADGTAGVELGPDVVFIHMTGMPDELWRRVRDTGVRVSVATPIEMAMRHGMPPLLKLQELGMEPSLSSDVETTLAADPFTLMRSTFTLQRALVNQQVLDQGDAPYPLPAPDTPPLLLARDVLRFATRNGAEHLGLGHRTGSITPGKEADLVVLDGTALNVHPVNDAAGAVVTLMDRSNVETVIVAGRIRKWRGRLLDADLAKLRDDLSASRDHLFAAAGIEQDVAPGR